ncbi:MAG: L-histidine N(alpha)-methyltransferase [Alphaproteobacteria bacterium]
MLNTASELQLKHTFALDAYSWFKEKRFGHMEKWQYGEPKYEGDLVRGAKLWDVWERVANLNPDNMLTRQGRIIEEQIDDMISLTKPRNTLLDLGPGGIAAITRNTLPFVKGYGEELSHYVSIDISSEAANNGARFIETSSNSKIKSVSLNDDFMRLGLQIPYVGQSVALFMGGTIGNFEARPNTSEAIELMATQITKLKKILPPDTVVFIGLESTTSKKLLFSDYDHPEHAEFEINIMHGIKRDVLPDADGFDPHAWEYSMDWYPNSYQFCHFAKATSKQEFSMFGEDITIPKGKRLLIDNSFKFPILAMQRSAQIAKTEYVRPFVDRDSRMAIHALKL